MLGSYWVVLIVGDEVFEIKIELFVDFNWLV